MTRLRTVCAGAALASVALLVPVASSPATAQGVSDSLHLTVVDVSPSTPQPTSKPQPFTITIEIVNTTSRAYTGVQILGERGYPIADQQSLDTSLANPTPTAAELPIAAHPAVPPIDIAGHSRTTVTFTTTTSTIDPFATTSTAGKRTGICLCAEAAIYPLFFSAHATLNGVDTLLGVTSTYVPSFDGVNKPQPVQVSWVWPLLEQPHRLTEGRLFIDDSLTNLVSPAGRLSRALQVVEEVGPTVPITLVVDPDLLDELEVMASGNYSIEQSDGTTVAGSGGSAAKAWLDRLHVVLTDDPLVQVELTPYGDPDFESLTAHGLDWVNTMPAVMSARVTAALAPRALDSSLAWPATGAISRRTLAGLKADGVNTVLLDANAVTPRVSPSVVQPGLTRLRAGGSDVIAALTSPAIEKYVAETITSPAASALPQVIAELAARAAQDRELEHLVVITAPRYVDPDVVAAARVIEDTSTSVFTAPTSIQDAVLNSSLLPSAYSGLARVPSALVAKDTTSITASATIANNLPSVRALIDTTVQPSARAAEFIHGLWISKQLTASSAWRSNALDVSAYARAQTDQIDRLRTGVKIVHLRSGTYTLASSTSPLPITIENDLQFPVRVRIEIRTLHAEPGFSTHDVGEKVWPISANTKRTVRIPTTTARSGRIQVEAELLTPNRRNPMVLGPNGPVALTLRSTALGVVGVVITIVAGVVLAVALVWRFTRRWLKRRQRSELPAGPFPLGEPERVP